MSIVKGNRLKFQLDDADVQAYLLTYRWISPYISLYLQLDDAHVQARLPTTDYWLTADYRLLTTDYLLLTTDY